MSKVHSYEVQAPDGQLVVRSRISRYSFFDRFTLDREALLGL